MAGDLAQRILVIVCRTKGPGAAAPWAYSRSAIALSIGQAPIAAVHRFHAASHRARIPRRSASVQCFSFAEEVTVIARIWHGYTKPEHADAYEAMLKPELLPGIGRVKSYRGSYLLRKEAGNEVEFITIMLWDSLDAIRAVTGPDYENAVIPEERRKYLSRHDAKSAHYEIA